MLAPVGGGTRYPDETDDGGAASSRGAQGGGAKVKRAASSNERDEPEGNPGAREDKSRASGVLQADEDMPRAWHQSYRRRLQVRHTRPTVGHNSNYQEKNSVYRIIYKNHVYIQISRCRTILVITLNKIIA